MIIRGFVTKMRGAIMTNVLLSADNEVKVYSVPD